MDINKAFEAYNGIKIQKVVIIDPSGDLVCEKSSNRIPLQEVEDTVSSAKSGLADTVNLQSGSIWLMAIGRSTIFLFTMLVPSSTGICFVLFDAQRRNLRRTK